MTPRGLITALEATGLTQAQIGLRADVTRKQVNSWKNGRAAMPYATRLWLAVLLKERTDG